MLKKMLTLSITTILTSIAVTIRRDKTILYSRISCIALLYSSYLLYNSYYYYYLSKGIGVLNGLVHMTSITHFFHFFIYLLSLIILSLTSYYVRQINIEKRFLHNIFFKKLNNSILLNKKSEQYKIIEYSLLLLFVILGATFLICSTDLVTMFISLELQSYGLYIVSTAYKNSESSTGGGLMYFLLGGLSSCFILLGTALLYVNCGTTNIDNIYIINNISNYTLLLDQNSIYWYNSFYINVSFILMGVGFLFKISAAPFHFWSPDVYDAIPTIVTIFVAIIAKISILILLLDFVHFSSNTSFNSSWTRILILSSLFSLIIGSILGLTQYRIKRLYAYSTISHIGFILLALSINTLESIQAFMFYLIQYSISNLNAFVLLLAIGYFLYNYTYKGKENYGKLQERNYSPIQFIDQLKGHYYINPLLAISLCITLFSFIGVPPLIGFFGKQMILTSAMDNGFYFMSFVGILTSVIGAVYYLIIIKQIFFYKSDYKLIESKMDYKKEESMLESYKTTHSIDSIKKTTLSSIISIIISILTLIILIFICIPNELLNLITIMSIFFLNE